MEGFLHLISISNKLCLQLVKLMQILAKHKPGFGNKAMCGCVASASVIVHKGTGENYSEQYQKITVGLFRCVSRSIKLLPNTNIGPRYCVNSMSLYDPCAHLTYSWTAET